MRRRSDEAGQSAGHQTEIMCRAVAKKLRKQALSALPLCQQAKCDETYPFELRVDGNDPHGVFCLSSLIVPRVLVCRKGQDTDDGDPLDYGNVPCPKLSYLRE